MKTNQEKKLLTLGDLITTGYLLCGKRRAVGIIRLAAEARLIWFKGKARFTIS